MREVSLRIKNVANEKSVRASELAKNLNLTRTQLAQLIRAERSITIDEGLVAARLLRTPINLLLAFDIIESLSKSELRSDGRDANFAGVIQYVLNIRGRDAQPNVDTCRADLSQFSVEQLVSDLNGRGWIVNLTRAK